MAATGQVASPPAQPVIIYDGDCTFCTAWVERWRAGTGESVRYLPAQDPNVPSRFPEIPSDHYDRAVQLIETNGRVYSGAEAVFRLLAKLPGCGWPLWLYEHVPGGGPSAEAGYRLVAGHRQFFGKLTRWLWGATLAPPTFQAVCWLFLKVLGVVYLIAFVSLWQQILGLIGSHGVLPAAQFMDLIGGQADQHDLGWDRYRLVPTLCWLGAGDGFLQFQCAAGAALAVLLIAGVAPALSLFGLWLLYLSLVTVGQDFLSFQWDNLLLETGWLAIFLAPLKWRPRWSAEPAPSRVVVWLLRWLLFRLMFQSGCIKLLSHDPLWRNLTALEVYYQTQPLPTWIGWYAHQLPSVFQQASTVVMFGIELAVPFLIFAPRRLRLGGAMVLAGLQVLIALSGNYCFFNILTLALCLMLLDDRALCTAWPAAWRRLYTGGSRAADKDLHPLEPGRSEATATAPGRVGRWSPALLAALTTLIAAVTLFQFLFMAAPRHRWPALVVAGYAWLAPFRTVNSYGLFASMTSSRPEIVIEGSNDGQQWRAYGFKYKPGDLTHAPGFVAPYQPRLDWQMWFAALGTYRQNPWFINLCLRLLKGSPDVLGLLGQNPFPEAPPRYIRALVYDYQFTNWTERRATGHWWRRTLQGDYCPVLSLSLFHRVPNPNLSQ